MANPQRAALFGVLNHRRWVVRRDDRQRTIWDAAERQLARMSHGAGIERGNLVVGAISAAEERRTELPGDLLHILGVDAGRLEPLTIFAEVLPGRSHEAWTLAQQRQRVGDIRRATPAPLVHRID